MNADMVVVLEIVYRAYLSPAPETYPFCCEPEVVVSLDVKLLFFGANLQMICWSVEDDTAQLFPSTEIVLFSVAGEKPVPDMVRICPPKLPVEGEIEVIVGREANSKYSPDAREGFLSLTA